MWEELGAVQGREFFNHTEFMRISGPDGRTLIVYADPDRLEAHLKELSPADSRLIHALCQGIRRFQSFDMSLMQQKPKDLMNQFDWAHLGMKMLPFVPDLARWALISASEFAAQFTDPFLRSAVPHIFAWPDIPVMVGMSLLAYMHNQNAGFPVGASLEFARALEKRYLELGGEIYYRSQVERILVENDGAVGLRLYTNEEHRAARVISACDGRTTIFEMLDGQYLNSALRRLYQGDMPIHSQIQVSVGINRDLSADPHWVTYLLDDPLLIAGQPRRDISVKNYCFDPSLAPPGKSVLAIMLTTRYEYWQRLYGRNIYSAEQLQESNILIDWIAQRYSGLRDQIEFSDVATPLSYERYTGNWKGSSSGWLLTKKTMPLMIRGVPKVLPGLKRFYLIGQWVEPGGGVPLVAMSGRNIVQQICHEDRKTFQALKP
jgi:phytoene dehydrogenase-like protein